MKTIAISIDEPTLEAIDRLARSLGRPPSSARRTRRARPMTRSELVRLALQDFLARREKLEREEREGRILARHRRQLARQAAALIAEQASP